ncbi:MAG: GAF domain-containing protein [Anaerolineae bacterium]|nr:GAF domain-containing protein [Anaerolineae bacterium]
MDISNRTSIEKLLQKLQSTVHTIARESLILDFFFIYIIRWLIVFGATLRFYLNNQLFSSGSTGNYLVFFALLVFTIYTLIVTIVSWKFSSYSESTRWANLQIFFDILLFTFLYLLTGRADSDFFLFFFLPLLISAEKLSFKGTLTTLFASILALVFVGITLSPLSLYETLFRIVFPRVIFYLIVVWLAFTRRDSLRYQSIQREILLSTSIRISSFATKAISSYELESIIRDSIRAIRKADKGSIYLVEEVITDVGDVDELLCMVAAVGFNPETTNFYPLQLGEGIAGWVVQHGIPKVVPDFQVNPNVTRPKITLESGGIQSSLCVPIRAQNKTFGAFCLDSIRQPDVFSNDDVTLLSVLADQIGTTIHNWRLFSTAQKQAEELRAIYDMTVKIVEQIGEENTDGRLQDVVMASVDLLKAQGGFIYLREGGIDSNLIRMVALQGIPSFDFPLGYLVKSGEGMAGRVIQTKQPLIVNNYSDWPHRLPKLEKWFSAVIEVPLIIKDQAIGVLGVFDDNRKRKFAKRELPVLERLAQHAALAIDKATLLETEKNLRVRANTLYDVSVAIRSGNDLNNVAETILDKLLEIVPYKKATMQRIDGDSRILLSKKGYRDEHINTKLLRPISQDNLVREIITKQEIMILSDPYKHPSWDVQPETMDVKSWIGIPLIYRDMPIGFISLDHDELGFYESKHRDLLTPIASQAAVAIENSILFQQLTQKIEDLSNTTENLDKVLGELENSRSLAMIGLVYGADIHLAKNKLGAAKTYAFNIAQGKYNDISVVKKNSDKIYKYINEYLNIVDKTRKKVQTPSLERCNINEIIDQAIGAVNIYRRIKITKNYDKTIDPHVLAPPHHLFHIIRNIVHNAVTAMGSTGELGVSTRYSDSASLRAIEVSISDTGLGIPEEIQSQLFEVDIARHKSRSGFGFGMAWARMFIRQYGGDIRFETIAGIGTTFYILVPTKFKWIIKND